MADDTLFRHLDAPLDRWLRKVHDLDILSCPAHVKNRAREVLGARAAPPAYYAPPPEPALMLTGGDTLESRFYEPVEEIDPGAVEEDTRLEIQMNA